MTHCTSTSDDLNAWVRSIIDQWQHTRQPDTLAALEEVTPLNLDKSLVVELAYEEFVIRTEDGEQIDPDEFCARFPAFQASIRNVLEAHRFILANQSVLRAGLPLAGLLPESDFLDYRIVRELGRGGFARVYLAWHELTGRHVVLKVSPTRSEEPRLLGGLNHPNVVPILDARLVDGVGLAVVMPYVGASTFEDLIDVVHRDNERRPSGETIRLAADRNARAEEIPPGRRFAIESRGPFQQFAAHLLLEIARGLEQLHERGIVHRDLKPSNVLLSWEARPVIVDFNLAVDVTVESHHGGTLPYMAPEQLQHIVGLPASGGGDERTDLYSFGVLAYQLLTGRHPFVLPKSQRRQRTDVTPDEYAHWIVGQQRTGCVPPRLIDATIDPRVEALILACLQFDANHRPRSAAEVIGTLEQVLAPAPEPRRKRLGRYVTTVVAAVSLVIGGSYLGHRVSNPTSPAQSPPDSVELAVEEVYQHQYVSAANRLNRLLPLGTTNARGHFFRGIALMRQGYYEEAVGDFRRASNQGLADPDVHAALARCLAQLKQHDEAILEGKIAIKSNPDSPAIHNNLAFSQLEGNKLTALADKIREADVSLTRAERLSPHESAVQFNRAVWFSLRYQETRDVGDLLKAIEMVEALSAAQTANPYVYRFGANCLMRLKVRDANQQRKALEWLSKAIRLGFPADQVRFGPQHRELTSTPEFAELLKIPAEQQLPDDSGRLMDPLIDSVP